jgi:anthranilate phosphoribosyltransferase
VIGVFEESLVDLIGNALIEIGSIEHAVVVHGCGLDEISPLGASTIYEIRNTAGNGIVVMVMMMTRVMIMVMVEMIVIIE